MPVAAWGEPVQISMPVSGRQTVQGPFAALIFLLDEWPDLRGPAYVRARSICRAAIAGRTSPEEARETFLRAASEANLLH
ncbi:DUF982 domain-containing protein [Agrobacterium bohemicum]|uniref:DUF982 domain-containing protein n=1 Tax=Agrobacterium bohemicum TaxID=2052828 RepID=A0A135P7A2_9HYPH|nr:DUF982 domain-containing protein [Agrobacterium bohemicum]KXG87302.1 hypothetical protein ATO67_20050 [Agrobacterium bohemicum]